MSTLIILLLVIALIVLYVKFQGKNSTLYNLRKLIGEKGTEIKAMQTYCSEINEKITALSRYEHIVDVQKEADRIAAKAKALEQKTEAEMRVAADLIEQELQKAQDVRAFMLQEARANAKALKEKAEQESQAKVTMAIQQTERLLKEARDKAREIGGEAYLALENSKKYEEIVSSMKNIIDGYGNKYIIPMQSYLDELADDFGFAAAGVELKKAREATRLLVETNHSGECEYVERERKESAIRFAVDAFNGKVDSILTGIKSDNYGTIAQKINDAFALINHLGSPFKGAKVKQEYLKSRLNEAYWACMVVELKNKQQEEQRQIREQIREEEKARREFEKAIKDAEKEEDVLKKAMEKVQKELMAASDEQKAKYEAKLAELNQKLQEAEDKNKRALSMAQQTRSGHVYVISNIGSFGEDVFKIGMTRRLEPTDRVRELGDASVPFAFDIHAMIYTDDAPTLEKDLHKTFVSKQLNKINPRKEFFKLTLAEIKEHVETVGVDVRWTLLAEAKEYRETMALEKEMAENGLLQEEWLRSQAKKMDQIEVVEEEVAEGNG